MDRSILKNVTFAVIVVVVGIVLRSIDSLSQTRIWRWSLGDLVAWASFTTAAAIAAYLAGHVGGRERPPVLGSAALSRILGLVALGVSLWLLNTAIHPVTTGDWLPIIQKVFAFSIVALAGYALWVAHSGFDEIARALAPVRPGGLGPAESRPESATAPRAAVAQPVFCTTCGKVIPADQKFCGSCGTARRPSQGGA